MSKSSLGMMRSYGLVFIISSMSARRMSDFLPLMREARSLDSFTNLYMYCLVTPINFAAWAKEKKSCPSAACRGCSNSCERFNCPDAFFVTKIGTLMATIAGRCLLGYKWLSTPLTNLSYFHIPLVYIGDNFSLFLSYFVNTVSVSGILSCRSFFILIFLRSIKMKHYGFIRKSI